MHSQKFSAVFTKYNGTLMAKTAKKDDNKERKTNKSYNRDDGTEMIYITTKKNYQKRQRNKEEIIQTRNNA